MMSRQILIGWSRIAEGRKRVGKRAVPTKPEIWLQRWQAILEKSGSGERGRGGALERGLWSPRDIPLLPMDMFMFAGAEDLTRLSRFMDLLFGQMGFFLPPFWSLPIISSCFFRLLFLSLCLLYCTQWLSKINFLFTSCALTFVAKRSDTKGT